MVHNSSLCAIEQSKRVLVIKFQPEQAEALLRDTSGIIPAMTKQSPVQRRLAAITEDILGGSLVADIRAALHDRNQGAIWIETGLGAYPSERQIVVAAGIATGLGSINARLETPGAFDDKLLTATNPPYRAGFQHAFNPEYLHTDGRLADLRPTDWLLLLIPRLEHARGGFSRLLHYDDWRECEVFKAGHFANRNVTFVAGKHRALTREEYRTDRHSPDYTIEDVPLFYDYDQMPCLRLGSEFMHTDSDEHYAYLDALQRSVENDPNVLSSLLQPGQLLIVNNRFWLHGRDAFERDDRLTRHLVRFKGRF